MLKRIVLTMMLSLPLVSTLGFPLNVLQPVEPRSSTISIPDDYLADRQAVDVTNQGGAWPQYRHDPENTGYSPSVAPNTNATLWKYITNTTCSSPAIKDGKVFVATRNRVICLDENCGTLIWENKNVSVGTWPRSPAVKNGKVFVNSGVYSGVNKVYALNQSTGSVIWNRTFSDDVESRPKIFLDKLYVGCNDGYLYCLYQSNGSTYWSKDLGQPIGESSAAVTQSRVFIGSGKKLYSLHATNGTKIWNYTTNGILRLSPAVKYGKVFFGSGDHFVYCLNSTNGSLIWKTETEGPIWASSPTVAYDKVYIHTFASYSVPNFHCLYANNGSFVWNKTFVYEVPPSPAVADGKVYIQAFCTYAFDAYNGSPIWKSCDAGNWLDVSPAIADGKVFVGADNGVWCFRDACLAGDTNGDGKVDHKDLLLLASAYGSEVGDPNYVTAADINCNGRVDHEDLLILAANYGKET